MKAKFLIVVSMFFLTGCTTTSDGQSNYQLSIRSYDTPNTSYYNNRAYHGSYRPGNHYRHTMYHNPRHVETYVLMPGNRYYERVTYQNKHYVAKRCQINNCKYRYIKR